jgi:uncharacterized protein
LNVFLDSSALAKRYLKEHGSDRVEEIVSSASAIAISVICLPEIVSALSRSCREGNLARRDYRKIKQALFDEMEDYSIINLTDIVVMRVVELLERWPLRSSDSLHVACAAEWAADLFVSADARQCVAARHCGLQVEEIGVTPRGKP